MLAFRPRLDFARALLLLAQPLLKTFSLRFYHDPPRNHYSSPPSALLPSSLSTDHLSCALHTLSQSPKLTSLKLGGSIVVSPELYWPADSSTPPSWPNLRYFHVTFDMTTPDGDWYFIRDPTKLDDDDYSDEVEDEADSSSESDTSIDSWDFLIPDSFNERKEDRAVGDFPVRMFRTLPSDSRINPLLLAMARAAGHMPQLQSMSLVSKLHSFDGAWFEIYYHAPGQRSNLDSEPGDLEKARLYWSVGKWRPDEEVLRIWRAGREEMKVKFVEW